MIKEVEIVKLPEGALLEIEDKMNGNYLYKFTILDPYLHLTKVRWNNFERYALLPRKIVWDQQFFMSTPLMIGIWPTKITVTIGDQRQQIPP